MSVSRCSGPRTRPSRCRPVPVRSTSCSPPARSTTSPAGPGSGGDDIQRELDSLSAGNDVELELAKLKGALPAGRGTRRDRQRRGCPRGDRRTSGDRGTRAGGAVVIIRILGEGQFDVPDGALDELNALDTALQHACEGGEDAAFAHGAHRAACPRTRARHAGRR